MPDAEIGRAALDRFLFLKRQAPGIWRQARSNKIRL